MSERDVAIVLSGGGMNGVLLELGFLKRLRVSSLWPRIGRIYGTSAGALTGTMAALDLLDELEEFVLGLQPGDIFRPQSLWRLPLNGLHEYALPATVAERMLDPLELGQRLAEAPVEVVIFATDVSDEDDSEGTHAYELAYSSHETPPEILAQAMLASAAISALVLPLPVGDRIATDGGWVRNFPLGAALDHPDVNLVVAFRYVPHYPHIGFAALARVRRQVEPLPRRPARPRLHRRARRGGGARAPRRAGPPRRHARPPDASRDPAQHGARGAARRRARRGDPGARSAAQRRHPHRDRACAAGPPRPGGTCCRGALRADCAADDASRGSRCAARVAPRVSTRGFRAHREWSEDSKRALIARGYAAADAELAAHGIDLMERAV